MASRLTTGTLIHVGRMRYSTVLIMSVAAMASQGASAQGGSIANLLLSTAWCQESTTQISLHTVRLTFFPDGTLRYRKEVDLANGSHNATNHSAAWAIDSTTLVIAEPNGGESRLPILVQGSGRSIRLTLGNSTYSVCR
jgi:hypothetical protein